MLRYISLVIEEARYRNGLSRHRLGA
eukprot:SAG22_NODE_11757_length_470_cov_1.601078_1_plen_25_part_10